MRRAKSHAPTTIPEADSPGQSPQLALLFTGAPTFAELSPAWTNRFISARQVRVSFLQPDAVRPLLTQPIPEFDLSYAPGSR